VLADYEAQIGTAQPGGERLLVLLDRDRHGGSKADRDPLDELTQKRSRRAGLLVGGRRVRNAFHGGNHLGRGVADSKEAALAFRDDCEPHARLVQGGIAALELA
jgi:hypothetical protein